MADFTPHIPDSPERPDIDIEEPTDDQRRAGILAQATRMAAQADWDTEIIAYLVSQKIPKVEAATLIPEIRENARPTMEKRFAGRRAIGWFLIFGALVVFAWAWRQEEKSIPGFIIALLPFLAGINQILKNRTPADDELGISD